MFNRNNLNFKNNEILFLWRSCVICYRVVLIYIREQKQLVYIKSNEGCSMLLRYNTIIEFGVIVLYGTERMINVTITTIVQPK